MPSSMTGLGRGIAQAGELTVETEIRSLNSRFLDISFRFPRDVTVNEFELRDLIKKYVSRGKLTVNIKLQFNEAEILGNLLDEDALETTMELLRKIKAKSGIEEKPTLDNVLSLQHFFFKEQELDTENGFTVIKESLINALEDLRTMRAKEGLALEKDITERLGTILTLVKKIESINKLSVQEYFSKLVERAEQLSAELKDNEIRLNTELALLVEKYDVTEECVRLKSHINMFKDALQSEGEIGRKLNFISQEMNREANTINSKAISTEILHTGILIKEELEKIREQIQNIE